MKAIGIKTKQRRKFFMQQVSDMKNINGHFYGLKSGWGAGGRSQQGSQQGQEMSELKVVGDWQSGHRNLPCALLAPTFGDGRRR